jgi:hypothetical protein
MRSAFIGLANHYERKQTGELLVVGYILIESNILLRVILTEN